MLSQHFPPYFLFLSPASFFNQWNETEQLRICRQTEMVPPSNLLSLRQLFQLAPHMSRPCQGIWLGCRRKNRPHFQAACSGGQQKHQPELTACVTNTVRSPGAFQRRISGNEPYPVFRQRAGPETSRLINQFRLCMLLHPGAVTESWSAHMNDIIKSAVVDWMVLSLSHLLKTASPKTLRVEFRISPGGLWSG